MMFSMGSDPIEGVGVGDGEGKEADDCRHVNEIHHGPLLPRLGFVIVKTAIFFPAWCEVHAAGTTSQEQNSCRE
jgi:hypothetical protein